MSHFLYKQRFLFLFSQGLQTTAEIPQLMERTMALNEPNAAASEVST